MSTQGEKLKAIADAIRAKDGSTAVIPAKDFPARIDAIQTGTDTADATAAASDILIGKSAYGASGKLSGTMPNRGAYNWTIGTTGNYVAIPRGYHNGDGKIRTDITNLVAENVKSGVVVGDVSGTFTSDATATASDIISGKVAYVRGSRIVGTKDDGTPAEMIYADQMTFSLSANRKTLTARSETIKATWDLYLFAFIISPNSGYGQTIAICNSRTWEGELSVIFFDHNGNGWAGSAEISNGQLTISIGDVYNNTFPSSVGAVLGAACFKVQ